MWEATVCSRKQTTPVADWNNDTLSDKHEQRPIKGNLRWSGKQKQTAATSKKKQRNQQKQPRYIIQDIVHQSKGRRLRNFRSKQVEQDGHRGTVSDRREEEG